MDVPDRVRRTYDLMHTNQTVESVRQRTEKWCKFNHAELTVMEALLMLDDLVDESDPDVSHLYLQRMFFLIVESCLFKKTCDIINDAQYENSAV